VPIDPFYLSWRARAYDTTTEFIELSGRLNVRMPYYAVRRVADALNADKKPLNGSRVFLLGASYKPNVGDTRESPSLKMVELLRSAGASVAYHDPHVPDLPELGLHSVKLSPQELRRADCVVIATDHDAVDLHAVVEAAPKVVDLRNAVRKRLGGPLPANVDVL
jgi:UDP-N-acetyl-D-glucosamine dehydrogenase